MQLFIDDVNRQLVTSFTDKTVLTVFPTLRQGEKPTMQFKFLTPVSTASLSAPFTVSDFTGYTMKVGICAGNPTGNSDTALAYQDSWTLSAGIWSAGLDLNTVPLGTALGTAAILACTIEVELTPAAGSPIKVLQIPVTIQSAVIDSATSAAGVAANYITRQEAVAGYVPREGPAGQGFILTSADGTKQGLIYWGDDGELHAESIL